SAPLASVTIALIFLGEPARWPLILGAVLIVAGGVELARDRGRPAHVRRRGGCAPRRPRPRPRPARAAGAHAARMAADAAVPRRRPPLRSLLRLALRGVLPRARDRRLADRRDGVALGRRALRAADPAHGARRPPRARGCGADRRGQRAHRRLRRLSV